MAIAVYFHPKGMTLDQFNDSHRRRACGGSTRWSNPPLVLRRRWGLDRVPDLGVP